jgi:hypothetical protein
MKLTDLNIRFSPNRRPVTICVFDQLIIDAIEGVDYEARFHPDSGVWVYRADCGDFVSCGAEMKGKGKAKIRMVDGYHTIADLHSTNGPAVNQLYGMDYPPVMDCKIAQGEGDDCVILDGHVNAIEVAKYLWASGQQIGIAVVKWDVGIRVYEPVMVDKDGPIKNKPGDEIVFLITPEKFTGASNDE